MNVTSPSMPTRQAGQYARCNVYSSNAPVIVDKQPVSMVKSRSRDNFPLSMSGQNPQADINSQANSIPQQRSMYESMYGCNIPPFYAGSYAPMNSSVFRYE